jgi:hypothetical protein
MLLRLCGEKVRRPHIGSGEEQVLQTPPPSDWRQEVLLPPTQGVYLYLLSVLNKPGCSL